MGDTTPLIDSAGTTHLVSVDRISTRDGGAAATNEEVQLAKLGWGLENDLKSASTTNPVPIRDYGVATALTGAGGGAPIASFTASQTVVVANANRSTLWISNGHATVGVWLTFAASAAVVGRGVYLPAQASAYFPYRGEVRVIPDTGTGGPIGYAEF